MISTLSTGRVVSSTFDLKMVILSLKLFFFIISLAYSAISAYSIPYTCFAPALAAKIESIPVPQPMSRTILSLNISVFLRIASL